MVSSTETPRSNTVPLNRDSWLRAFMDKISLKEDGSNFLDWESILRSAAISDGKLRYLEDPSPPVPSARATSAVQNAYDEYER